MSQKATKKHAKNARHANKGSGNPRRKTASVPRKPRKQRFTRRTVPGIALLSARQIVNETGMGLRSVYDELDAGTLPSKRVGNRRYVSRPVFEQWLATFGKDAAA
jgi:hypothetical protein